MIGVIGVAPVHGAVLTVDNGPHGGNLDVQEITAGNTVLLRVNREGAHLESSAHRDVDAYLYFRLRPSAGRRHAYCLRGDGLLDGG